MAPPAGENLSQHFTSNLRYERNWMEALCSVGGSTSFYASYWLNSS